MKIFRIDLTLALLFMFLPPSASAELKVDYTSRKQGRIAFTYNDGKRDQIWVIDFGSKTLTPLLKDEFNNTQPAWSADGTKLAFSSDRSGNKEIFVINSDGSNLKQLTKSSGDDEYPEWSPDGKSIVFNSKRGQQGANIFIMDQDGTNQRQLLDKPLSPKRHQNLVPRFSPRENELLFTTDVFFPGYDMVLYDLRTKSSTPLTVGRGSYSRGNWSPDGGEIIFTYGTPEEADLWTIKKGSGIPSQLTKLAGREFDAVWIEPDTAIFVSEEQVASKIFQLYEIDMTSKEVRPLTMGDGSVRYPSWTPFTALPPLPEPAANEKAEQKK